MVRQYGGICSEWEKKVSLEVFTLSYLGYCGPHPIDSSDEVLMT